MTTSPKLGLTLTPALGKEKHFIDFRTELSGDEPTSNMMIIDRQLGHVVDRCAAYDTKPFTWGMLKNGLGHAQDAAGQEG